VGNSRCNNTVAYDLLNICIRHHSSLFSFQDLPIRVLVIYTDIELVRSPLRFRVRPPSHTLLCFERSVRLESFERHPHHCHSHLVRPQRCTSPLLISRKATTSAKPAWTPSHLKKTLLCLLRKRRPSRRKKPKRQRRRRTRPQCPTTHWSITQHHHHHQPDLALRHSQHYHAKTAALICTFSPYPISFPALLTRDCRQPTTTTSTNPEPRRSSRIKASMHTVAETWTKARPYIERINGTIMPLEHQGTSAYYTRDGVKVD
jgi:hypothetical protein